VNASRLYLDEDVYAAVGTGLLRRGVDVLTTRDAGRGGSSDEEQLGFATTQGRALLTFNRGHFAELHGRTLTAGRHHCGIILSRQTQVGAIVRAMCGLLASHDAAWFQDRLVWLDAE